MFALSGVLFRSVGGLVMNRVVSSRFASSDPFLTGRLEMNRTLVRFGNRSFAPADIVSFRVESEEKASFLGSVCGFALFLALGALLLEAIVAQVFPYRTLVGAVSLGAVGFASLQDSWRERGDGFFRLFVSLRGAPDDVMVFATSERHEVVKAVGRLAEVLNEVAQELAHKAGGVVADRPDYSGVTPAPRLA